MEINFYLFFTKTKCKTLNWGNKRYTNNNTTTTNKTAKAETIWENIASLLVLSPFKTDIQYIYIYIFKYTYLNIHIFI